MARLEGSSKAPYLVVGLGNPGPEYRATRHNVGFLVVDELARRAGAASWRPACRSLLGEGRLGEHPLLLAEPQTFMNRSGLAVRTLLALPGLDLARTVVVHDDLDLPLARLRIRRGGGHGGHRGVRSIVECLGSGDFNRLKVGIGRPPEGEEVVDFVLSPFSPEERAALPELLDRAADAVESIIVEGPDRAMNRFHS